MNAVDVLVIGGGQAGLATAYWLKRFGPTFMVLEALARPGQRWRDRYRSLTLFTPREFSGLPGMTLPGDPQGYATAAEFADYLENYAAKFVLQVRTNQRVTRLVRSEAGFLAELASGAQIDAAVVIVATGGLEVPIIPAMAANLLPEVQQLSAATYRTPTDVSARGVVVVGDGATGRDIAAELAATHTVALACGRPRRVLPQKLIGIGIWKWLRAMGLLHADANSPVGRRMRKADPFPGQQRDLSTLGRQGVELKPRVVAANGRELHFADGSSLEVQSVVWALGYRDDSAWLDIEVRSTRTEPTDTIGDAHRYRDSILSAGLGSATGPLRWLWG